MKLTHEILLELGFRFVQFPSNDSNIKYYELDIKEDWTMGLSTPMSDFFVSIIDNGHQYQAALEDVNTVYEDNNYDHDSLEYELYNVDSVQNLLEVIGIVKYQEGRDQKAQEIRKALQIQT